MEFRILGHLQVLRDGEPVYLDSAPKPRLLLAVLLAKVGQPLALDELVDALWSEAPPASARRNIHQYIHRLRSNLGSSVLTSRPGGYQVSADTWVDSLDFIRLKSEAATAVEVNDLRKASELFRAALDLWQGEAFAGFRDNSLIAAAASKLDRARLAASEQLADLEIRLGNAHSVVEMLAELAEANPFQESLQASWMRSLHASGRQAEALEVFHRTRSALVEHLGVEPSDELRSIHRAILTGHDLNPTEADVAAIPRELPAVVTNFTGRQESLVELESTLVKELDRPVRPVVISAISGMAGIGKTALAVFWGHSVAHRFPDGQIYINLRGYADAEPVTTIAALSALLGSLGLRPEQIPVGVSEAAARYRTMLAGRKILVVLDNARSVEQVRPLLPGSSGCLALITSRDRLTGLIAQDGAQRLVLGSLSTAEAIELLESLLGRDIIAAEPDAAEQLATICAGLPLALRIAAAQLADNPHGTLRNYVKALRTQNVAASLSAGESGVKTAFESSYRALPPVAQLAFRHLGLLPLKDFAAETVARLCNVGEPAAVEAMNCLANAHLVQQHQSERYAIHDLLREYAATLGEEVDSPVDRAQAIQRLFDWYVATVHAAADQLYSDFVRAPIPRYPFRAKTFDSVSARRWLDAERQNLVSAIQYAVRNGPADAAWMLVDGLRGYYNQQRHVSEYVILCRGAVAASRHSKNIQGRAAALIALAQACYYVARYKSSITYLKQAYKLAGEAMWTAGEASSSSNLGMTLNVTGVLHEAVDWLEKSIAAARRLDNPLREAISLCSLATVYRDQGRLADGVAAARRSQVLFEGCDSRVRRVQSIETLGQLYLEMGHLESAQRKLRSALKLHRGLNKPVSASLVMVILVSAELGLGNIEAARALATASMDQARSLRESLLGAYALNALASVACASGNLSECLDLYQHALLAANDIKAPMAVLEAHLGLADAYANSNRYDLANSHCDQALEISSAAGYRVKTGKSLLLKARIYSESGNPHAAGAYAQQALLIQRSTGHQPGVEAAEALLTELRQGAQKAKATG